MVGGVERGSNNIFLVPVMSQNKDTLQQVVKDNVLPGTHIVTDCFSRYDNFRAEGYTYCTINHSLNFMDLQWCPHPK